MIDSAQQMRTVHDRLDLLVGMARDIKPLLGDQSPAYKELYSEMIQLNEAVLEAPFVSCPHLRKMIRQGYRGDHCTPSCWRCCGTDWVPL